jgi:hypothetical protein
VRCHGGLGRRESVTAAQQLVLCAEPGDLELQRLVRPGGLARTGGGVVWIQ